MVSKLEIEGKIILDRIFKCDSNVGGSFISILGSQGSGKTATQLSIMRNMGVLHPDHRLFWASTFFSPLQFTKLEDSEYQILIEKDAKITFHDRDNWMKEIQPDVLFFDSYEQCVARSDSGICNAVFFKKREHWMPFIHHLRKNVPSWNHVFVDEMGDIAPENQAGTRRKLQELFVNDCAEARKSHLTICYNTQQHQDIDWRLRAKVMIIIYLPGAKAMHGRRVKQSAIDCLPKDPIHGNHFYIEYDGQFGRANFKNGFFNPRENRNWQANIEENEYQKILKMYESDKCETEPLE